MSNGHPPTTFIYGCPPPPRDEPKFIMPVMPRQPFPPTQDPMQESVRALEVMRNKPDYSTVIAKLDALEKYITGWAKTLNDSVATAQTKTFAQYAEANAKLDKVEALLARVNNQVATINEFIASLRAVPSVSKRKRKKPQRKREWRGSKFKSSRQGHPGTKRSR